MPSFLIAYKVAHMLKPTAYNHKIEDNKKCVQL
jgi:hypothetical protein